MVNNRTAGGIIGGAKETVTVSEARTIVSAEDHTMDLSNNGQSIGVDNPATGIYLKDYVSNLGDWAEVRVRWRDAYSPHSGWHEVDEYTSEDAIATTVGRVWQNCNEHYLTTVGTVFDCDDIKTVGDINHIPWAMILDVFVIQKGKTHEE